jgi:MFS family permease
LGRDVAESGRGWSPLLSASAMAATDHSYGYALVVLSPEIARSLHIPISAVAALAMFRGVAFFAAGGLVAAALRRRVFAPQSVATVAAVVRVAALLLTGLVTAPWALVAGVALYGLASVSTPFAHRDLLVAAYGPSDAVAAFHRSALRIGNVVVAAAIAPVVLISPSHWPTVFVVLGVISLVGPLGALVASGDSAAAPVEPFDAGGPLEGHDTLTRWLSRPGLRLLLAAFAIGGLFEVPLYVYAFGDLSNRWRVGAPNRAAVAAGLELGGVVLGALAVRNRLRRDNAGHGTTARVVGATMVAGSAVLALSAAVGQLSDYVVLVMLAMGMFGFMAPLLFAGTLTMLPPLRVEFWSAIPTVLLVIVAGGSSAALAWVAATFGDHVAVACFALPAAVIGVLIIAAARAVDAVGVPAWWSRWPVPASVPTPTTSPT